MGDVSSGMASTVIQLYLKEILGSFLHTSTVVRSSAMKVVQLVLAQGLVHPVQVSILYRLFSVLNQIIIHLYRRRGAPISNSNSGHLELNRINAIAILDVFAVRLNTKSHDM